MVLSEKELGLSDDHEGIIELPADAPIGSPLVDVLGDAVIDITTWANRADLLGVHGVAREVGRPHRGVHVRDPEAAILRERDPRRGPDTVESKTRTSVCASPRRSSKV